MDNFNFSIPTNLVFGKDRHKEVGSLISSYGVKKVMLVYDSGRFLVESGLLDEVRASLKDAGLEVTELTGVKPNPVLSLVHKGVDQAREFGAQFLLALGGGSTIDCSKAIAVGFYEEGDLWEMIRNAYTPAEKALPLVDVLTISATGSEFDGGGVISNPETNEKLGALRAVIEGADHK